jgi:hypothetical protein
MIARWSRSSTREHGVPVELRFIDMFMATVGALIFMAMLFSWVIAHTKHEDVPVVSVPGTLPLTLLTKALPPARVGQARRHSRNADAGNDGPIRRRVARCRRRKRAAAL